MAAGCADTPACSAARPRSCRRRRRRCRSPTTRSTPRSSTLALCTVDDPERAIGELRRVLRPGRDASCSSSTCAREDPGLARWQDRLAPVWRRVGHGCNCNRPTARAESAGRIRDRGARARTPAEGASVVRPLIAGRAVGPLSELRREPGCAFCAIVHGEAAAHIVLEDESTIAFLDNRPLFPGHTPARAAHARRHAARPARRRCSVPLFANARLLAGAMVAGLRRRGLVRRAQQRRQPERSPPARARRAAPPQGRPARVLLAAHQVPRTRRTGRGARRAARRPRRGWRSALTADGADGHPPGPTDLQGERDRRGVLAPERAPAEGGARGRHDAGPRRRRWSPTRAR